MSALEYSRVRAGGHRTRLPACKHTARCKLCSVIQNLLGKGDAGTLPLHPSGEKAKNLSGPQRDPTDGSSTDHVDRSTLVEFADAIRGRAC